MKRKVTVIETYLVKLHARKCSYVQCKLLCYWKEMEKKNALNCKIVIFTATL